MTTNNIKRLIVEKYKNNFYSKSYIMNDLNKMATHISISERTKIANSIFNILNEEEALPPTPDENTDETKEESTDAVPPTDEELTPETEDESIETNNSVKELPSLKDYINNPDKYNIQNIIPTFDEFENQSTQNTETTDIQDDTIPETPGADIPVSEEPESTDTNEPETPGANTPVLPDLN